MRLSADLQTHALQLARPFKMLRILHFKLPSSRSTVYHRRDVILQGSAGA